MPGAEGSLECSCGFLKFLQGAQRCTVCHTGHFYEAYQGSTFRKNFISPAGLVTVTFTSPETTFLALIMISITTFSKY